LILTREDGSSQHPFERRTHREAFVAAIHQTLAAAGIDRCETDVPAKFRFHCRELVLCAGARAQLERRHEQRQRTSRSSHEGAPCIVEGVVCETGTGTEPHGTNDTLSPAPVS
jgi:hypothetical protein